MTKKGKSKSPIILTPGMTVIPGQEYTLPDPSPPEEKEEEYVHPRQKQKMRRWQQKKGKGRVRRAVATKQRY